jgi:hypothetical protein
VAPGLATPSTAQGFHGDSDSAPASSMSGWRLGAGRWTSPEVRPIRSD